MDAIDITSFEVRAAEIWFGRKELEEFGMVNLATTLNRFHRNKQKPWLDVHDDELWLVAQSQYEFLLSQGEAGLLEQRPTPWLDSAPPNLPGIYTVCIEGCEPPLYIGESSSLQKRHEAHSSTTYFSALRRHIGTVTLGFKLQCKGGKKRYFRPEEDAKVDEFLRECHFACLPVAIGRVELEEMMIRNHRPILNRKDNKG